MMKCTNCVVTVQLTTTVCYIKLAKSVADDELAATKITDKYELDSCVLTITYQGSLGYCPHILLLKA